MEPCFHSDRLESSSTIIKVPIFEFSIVSPLHQERIVEKYVLGEMSIIPSISSSLNLNSKCWDNPSCRVFSDTLFGHQKVWNTSHIHHSIFSAVSFYFYSFNFNSFDMFFSPYQVCFRVVSTSCIVFSGTLQSSKDTSPFWILCSLQTHLTINKIKNHTTCTPYFNKFDSQG